MDEETEVLDWEEDEEQANIPTQAPVDDADGVSLGSDSGDEAENVEPEPEPPSAPAPSSLDPPIQVQEETADSTTESASPRDFSAKPNDSSPLNSPPQPQNRSQRPRSKPLSAAQMMAHGLPPKPVASAVPFLPSSHSSLTEATAMATRETGKGKAASSSSKTPAAKSTFPDESDPLPPYWEIRHPRSGGRQVYYYNTRTHESTWILPVSIFSSKSILGDLSVMMSFQAQSRSHSSFPLPLPLPFYSGI
ncbi:hypothetical protein GYMLUDRAFT_886758 [Collybiopsis luxurians FD-317 M1]|uniref:WW domain-containing protein n=1 Tax=Collybiopsis luxurians FD-317 M1 TaxID=944289 RepID=A0A0D0CAH7_9AGAR|nr:hypothetical protein GYMLUDRAFT_886758 [Collybiopsis luxurians FD-317 M1]